MKHLLLTLYLLLVFFTVFVAGNEYRFSHRFAELRTIRLYPFKDKIYFFQHPELWPGNNLSFFLKEAAGNLLLLFPLPVILVLFYKISSSLKVVIYSFLLSCLIESIQVATDMGSGDIDDVILNTLGAVGGIFFARWVRRQRFWFFIRTKLRLH